MEFQIVGVAGVAFVAGPHLFSGFRVAGEDAEPRASCVDGCVHAELGAGIALSHAVFLAEEIAEARLLEKRFDARGVGAFG